MLQKEACLNHVVSEVEDLSCRVALLKGRFAKQKVSVKLEHYWELELVRNRFTEFKRCVEELEEAESEDLAKMQQRVDTAWQESIYAVESLLSALS